MMDLFCPICMVPLSSARSVRQHLTSPRHNIEDKEKLLLLTKLASNKERYIPFEGDLAKNSTSTTGVPSTPTIVTHTRTIDDPVLGLHFAPNDDGNIVITRIRSTSSLYADETSFRGAIISHVNSNPVTSMKSLGPELTARPLTLTLLTSSSSFISTPVPAPKSQTTTPLHPLLEAARSNQTVTLAALLSLHCPLLTFDRHGSNALHYAAGAGALESVVLLLEHRVPVDCTNGNDERTPFHWSARNGHLQTSKLLVRAGADCRRRTIDGTSALHWAFWNQQLLTCKYLLSVVSWSSPQVNEANSYDCTATHFIGLNGDIDCLKLFVEHGGNVFKRNNQGHTIVHKAAWRGREKLLAYLEEAFPERFRVEAAKLDGNGYTPSDISSLGGHDTLTSWFSDLLNN